MMGKYRVCNCTEVGISDGGIVMALLKQHYPNVHWVERCGHWIEFDFQLNQNS